jgi:purine-binding chemotaxis protein CheW
VRQPRFVASGKQAIVGATMSSDSTISQQGVADAQAALSSTQNKAGMYLTFKLASEEYGVEILKVREIIGFMKITAVPQMPCYMKGVINLRGKVIPVVDLRLKFGLQEAEHTDQTCIIVVDVGTEIGVIVDTVSEVLDIAGDDIDPPPVSAGTSTEFILGMGKVNDEVKILLNINKVLSQEEVQALSSVAATGEGF